MSSSGVPKGGSQFWAARGPELTADLTEIVTRMRRDYAAALDLIAEMETEQIARHAGYSSLAAFLTESQRIAPARASRMVAQALQVAEMLTPTGHTTPAPLPSTRQALHEGVLDGEHVEAVAEAVKQLPTWASTEDRELVETTLADTARTSHPRAVREQGQVLLARLDQDGAPPAEADQAEPVNTLRCQRLRNGRMKFAGEIDPEAAEEFEGLLGELAKPRPLAKDVPDPRPRLQRYGDAFTDIVHRAATGRGGSRTRLTVTLDLNFLLEGIGAATFEGGSFLPHSTLRQLACDCELIPMVLGTKSLPLDVGRKYRLVKPQQRRALIARDRGCAFPGCCMPARWTDAHHIRHWIDGGSTDMANLVLLCRRHHRLLHHSEWEVTIRNGLPEFTPPKWVDYHQRPLRNTLRT
jgi:Domain of unknown function (DUF222)/HNH endonuclease